MTAALKPTLPSEKKKPRPGFRPLSPHLQIYRPQISSVLSITHRLAGLFLAAGLFFLTWFLVALSRGAEYYSSFAACAGSLPGQLGIAAFIFAGFYFICLEVRYLFWDTGRGFDLAVMARSGWAAVWVSIALTLFVYFYAFFGGSFATLTERLDAWIGVLFSGV